MNISRTLGQANPLGATIVDGGNNFSVFSRNATGVELLLFDHADDSRPARTLCIDPTTNRTYRYWHVFVPDLLPGQIYSYRVYGPSAPAHGLRFDPSKVLLDPVLVPPLVARASTALKYAMVSSIVTLTTTLVPTV
jgi:isoamylase